MKTGVLELGSSGITNTNVRDFRAFDVWHESIRLARKVYDETRTFPRDERFGLTSQMRSAAVSISSNIAEGAGRGSRKELARFLQIAVGSVCELDSQLELAIELKMCERGTSLSQDLDILRRRLIRLIDRVAPHADSASDLER